MLSESIRACNRAEDEMKRERWNNPKLNQTEKKIKRKSGLVVQYLLSGWFMDEEKDGTVSAEIFISHTIGYVRLFFFPFSCFVLFHLSACLWI
jgi:hypothetical protein